MIILLILQDVPFSHLTAILEFMYAGEVFFVSFNFPLNVLEYASFKFNIPGECGPRAAACLPEDCREVEDQGAGGRHPRL